MKITYPLIAAVILLTAAPSVAQNSTIGNLTADSAPTDTDQYIVQKSGETRAKKQTRPQIARLSTGTSLPGTCTLGDRFWDTDADTDGSLYVCSATNTWKEVDDDGATLTGDVDGPVGSNDIDEVSVESELEGVIDFSDLQGQTAWISNVTKTTADILVSGVEVDFEAGASEGYPRLAQSTTPPSGDCDAAAEAGRLYFDSDADTDGSVFVCRGTLGWKDVDDDGAGGASGNSFETLSAPTGTSPVADSATDTLTLLEGDGIVLTGSAAADSLTVANRDPLARADLSDDFVSGSAETGEYGRLGWSNPGGTPNPAWVSSEANHPGILRSSTAASSGAVRSLALGPTATAGVWLPADTDRLTFVFRLQQATLVEVRVGMWSDSQSGSGGTDGVYLEFASASSANWQCVTKASSTATTTNSTVAASAATWYQVEIVRQAGGSYEFWINGVLRCTNSTNLPTTALMVAAAVETGENVAKDLDVDYFRLTSKVLGARF